MTQNTKKIKIQHHILPSYHRYCAFALYLMMVWLTGSCTSDEIASTPERIEEFVRIELHLPGEPHSYALSEPDENDIRELDILLFRETPNGEERYLDRITVPPGAITTYNGDPSGRTKSCIVKVPADQKFRQRLVFIANAHTKIPNLSDNALKQDVLASLTYTMNEYWPAVSSASFTPFPMWGELDMKQFSTSFVSAPKSIHLMRMVARTDVKVHADLLGSFELHEVYLYNRFTHGSIAPNPNVLEGSGTSLKVKAPTIPQGATPTEQPLGGPSTPARYTTDKNNLTTVTRRIYLMENAPEKNPMHATCFVIGGKYKKGAMRYWRVDLPKQGHTDFTNGFRTFLRNNAYEVILKSVKSEGYGTPDDAFRSMRTEIEVDVAKWNLMDIIFGDNQQYTLKVSPSTFHYVRQGTAGTQGKFSIWSDYFKSNSIQGWRGEWVYPDSDGSWLHVTPQALSGNKEQMMNYLFTVDENTTGLDRHAYLMITAGNLKKQISIVQSHIAEVNTDTEWKESEQSETPLDGPYRLKLSKQSFDCSGKQQTLSITVTAESSSREVQWQATTSNDWIMVHTPTGKTNVIDTPLSFQISENNTPNERVGTIRVTVIHAGNKLSKDIRVKQYGTSEQIIQFLRQPNLYFADASIRQKITIHSKMNWNIRVKSDPSGMLRTLHTTGGGANQSGTDVWFALNTFTKTSPPKKGRSPYLVTFEVSSPTGAFDAIETKISVRLIN